MRQKKTIGVETVQNAENITEIQCYITYAMAIGNWHRMSKTKKNGI